MKTKLRKIIVENEDFIYITSQNYDYIGNWSAVLRVFLSGYKKTPLTIYFDTLPDSMIGNPFCTCIYLENKLTETKEMINIHLPSLVEKIILYGQQIGWTGKNEIDKLNGITVLQKWGFDTSNIAYWNIDEKTHKRSVRYYEIKNID